MIKQNTIYRIIAVFTLLFLLAPNVSAECSIQDAEKRIKEFYEAISEAFREPNSGKSLLKWKKNVLPMLLGESEAIQMRFFFPNETKLLFGSEDDAKFHEAHFYFLSFNKNRLENIGSSEERQRLLISMDCQFGKMRALMCPVSFADKPKDRQVEANYYEMCLAKTYSITDLSTNKVKKYTLHDTIYVRACDGAIATLKNECGGRTSVESAISWDRKDYQEAYRLYREIYVGWNLDEGRPVPARVCFFLGLMMYDQYKGRAVYDPELDKKKAALNALSYLKKGAQMTDEPEFAKQCQNAYDYIATAIVK